LNKHKKIIKGINILLGERLKQFRKNIGLSQAQLADILGIDRSTYAYYETNKTNPSIPFLIILSKIFCVTVDELIGIDESLKMCDSDSVSAAELVTPSVPDELLTLSALSKEERVLIAKYRLLKERDKSEIKKIINDKQKSELE